MTASTYQQWQLPCSPAALQQHQASNSTDSFSYANSIQKMCSRPSLLAAVSTEGATGWTHRGGLFPTLFPALSCLSCKIKIQTYPYFSMQCNAPAGGYLDVCQLASATPPLPRHSTYIICCATAYTIRWTGRLPGQWQPGEVTFASREEGWWWCRYPILSD